METECPYLAQCPMFKHFTLETTKKFYINLYCCGKYRDCERYKMRQRGVKPSDRLLPDGQEMPD
jgi:hypothetical protein